MKWILFWHNDKKYTVNPSQNCNNNNKQNYLQQSLKNRNNGKISKLLTNNNGNHICNKLLKKNNHNGKPMFYQSQPIMYNNSSKNKNKIGMRKIGDNGKNDLKESSNKKNKKYYSPKNNKYKN